MIFARTGEEAWAVRFCPGCGNPLSYKDGRLPRAVCVPVGAFDGAGDFEAEVHEWRC